MCKNVIVINYIANVIDFYNYIIITSNYKILKISYFSYHAYC